MRVNLTEQEIKELKTRFSSFVLDELKKRGHECDIRSYFQELEEIVFLENASKGLEEVEDVQVTTN